MMRLRLASICVLALSIAATVPAVGDVPDWPAFHGPRGDNICRETGLMKAWPKGGPPLIRTLPGCGLGFSTVSIADGSIYTAGKFDKRTFVLAFDMKGKERWRARNGQAWEANPRSGWAAGFAGARATPTIDDGVVYHLNETGRLTALTAKDGKELWGIELTGAFKARQPQWAYSESVLIEGEKLLCYPGGQTGRLVALNKKTGKVIWANTTIGDEPSYCSGVVVSIHGVRQFVTMTAASVIGARLSDGELLWKAPFANMRGINVATPIVHGNRVFVSSGYGKGCILVELTRTGDRFEAEKLWSTKDMDNHHGGLIKIGDHVYGSGANRKGWACLDFATGKQLYRAAGGGKGSVLYAEGLLYCRNEDGLMELVRPSPDGRKVISSFRVPEGGKGKHWSHPVIHNGLLYLRHADKIFIYDVRAK